MKILITGCAGLLGSNLCNKLVEGKNQVVGVDNLLTGSKENLQQVLMDRKFKFIEADITQSFQELPEIDAIYHLAAPASPVQYQKNPLYTIQVITQGTLNMLKLAKKNNASFLHASSSEIYGEPSIHPQKEDYHGYVNPLSLRACYNESKRLAETICMNFYREYQLPIKIVRIFNTYGPGMQIHDGRVISNFIMQAMQDLPITIYREGIQTRSFCYVEDMIESLIKVMELKATNGKVMNLGNPEEISILELAKKILRYLPNTKSEIIYQELPEGDPSRRKPDIELAKKMLDWEPRIALEEGLQHTIAYFKENYLKS